MPKCFQIESDQEDIILRFNRDLVDPASLSRLLNYVELSSLRQKSELTSEQADALSDEIDAAVWEKVQEKYTS